MKIALVLSDDFSMWHFFRGLIEALIEKQLDVYVVTPSGPYVPALRGLGATHLPVKVSRFIDPLGDLRFFVTLLRLFRRHKIDIVCNITIKPIVYGAIAARLAHVRHVVGMVEGLGYSFMDATGWTTPVFQQIARQLYRVGCALSDRVGVANTDDLEYVVKEGIVKSSKARAFRSMVGVNVTRVSPAAVDHSVVERLRAELRLNTSVKIVALVSRVVWSKGIKEFVQVSREASGWSQPMIFLLVGPLEPGAQDAVPEDYLLKEAPPGFIWMKGFRPELREILFLADVVTLPSYYREGIPRVLLEALAMGKPIVTTDNVGCRELVDEGKNGFLVPPRDALALASAIRALNESASLRARFGTYSRAKAEAEFDERVIVKRVIAELCAIPD